MTDTPEEETAMTEATRDETPETSEPAAAPAVAELLAARDARVADLEREMLYLRAEFDTIRKRTEKRHREALEYAAEPLLRDLLPVLDNLERAVGHAGEESAESLGGLLAGLGHVISQFREVLGRHGVEAVRCSGDFDPGIHEALAPVPGEVDNQVGQVCEQGYTLKGRLLRPARVTVTKVAP